MSESRFSYASTNSSSSRRKVNRCWCDLESPLMTSWSYANPGRRFYGCGNFRVMRKKGCNHFEWFDEEMSNRAKDVIRSLKDKNDELVNLMSDTRKNEELLKMKARNEELLKKKMKFMGYFMGLVLVFVLLVVFALVVLK
ncbi:uncharacterized protein At4g04775-like [Vicia villosa]|uniref:uncharacterized protein At4g04775-like n=1 Tax=Vicia villosa TaxID=3911 RepID=UPI00273B65B8|nr:uncharacterized protein At4g04775-like [Vicia villosa]